MLARGPRVSLLITGGDGVPTSDALPKAWAGGRPDSLTLEWERGGLAARQRPASLGHGVGGTEPEQCWLFVSVGCLAPTTRLAKGLKATCPSFPSFAFKVAGAHFQVQTVGDEVQHLLSVLDRWL